MASKKIIVSNILHEPRDWKNANEVKPEAGQLVVIRMMNPTIIYAENEKEIYPSEDMKIGEFIRNATDPSTGVWVIAPPHPRFDYSPLSDKERLNDETLVTHWAIPEEGELEGWRTRFDQTNLYKKLNIEVDDDHLELVYRALVWGAAFIQKYNPDEPEAKYLAHVLYDLQYVIDTGKGIELSDEEYEAKLEEQRMVIEKRKNESERITMKRVESEINRINKERENNNDDEEDEDDDVLD